MRIGPSAKFGNDSPNRGQEAEGAVVPAVAMQGRAHSGGNRQQQRDGERRQRQLQRPRVGLADDLSDVLVVAQRLAHVAVHQAAPVVHILRAERNIEAIGVAGGGDVGGGSAFAQHLLDGVAGDEVNQQEDHRHDQPDDRQHVEQAGSRGSGALATPP